MKKTLIGAAAVAACAALYYIFVSPVAPLYWQTGARQMYEFSHMSDVALKLPVGEMTTSRQTVSGTFNVRVFEVGRDRVKIGIQLSPVTVMAGGKRVPGLEKVLSAFFLAEATPEGRFTRFHFDPGVSKEDGRGLMYILQSFQGIIRPGRSPSWSETEADGIGEYRSGYTAKKRYVVKKKEEFIRINNPGLPSSVNSDVEAVIGENSKLIIHYGKPASWLQAARGVDKIDLLTGGRKTAGFTMVTNLRLVEYAPDPELRIWKQEGSFDALAVLWGSGPRRTGSFWKDLEAEALKKKYAGRSFGALMRGFTATGKIVPWESITALKDFLLVNPAECRRVPGFLRNGTLDGTQQAALIHVLELAGHAEAQKTLVNIFNDRSHTMMNRMRSIIALSGVGSPSDASIDSLLSVGGARENASARELSNTAILGLGSVSNTLAGVVGDEDADRRRKRINEYLAKELAVGAGDADKKAAVLAAIGNSRDASFTETIMPSLDDGNVGVRASAVRAVVAVGDESARESVVGRLGAEKRNEVKTAALNSLYEKPVMDSALRYIAGSIGGESDARVRNSMLRYLVKNRDSRPGVADTLRTLAQSEPNAENRRLIYQGLYSKQK